MLKIINLTKSFGSQPVLQGVNLEAETGTIFALVGPNGAGKTTLLRIIMGTLLCEGGQVLYKDQDLPGNPAQKERLAFIPETPGFDPDFTGHQLAKFYRLAYKSWNEERYGQFKESLQLPLNKKVRQLSKGMKTQLAFLLNLSITPELLLLDEPTAGLDPHARRQILNLIVDEVAAHGTTVVIASHNLLELERVCDSFGILHLGKIILSQQMDAVKASMHKVQVVFPEGIPQDILSYPGLLWAEQVGKIHTLVINEPSLLEVIRQAKPAFMEALDISMEEIYLSVVGGGKDVE